MKLTLRRVTLVLLAAAAALAACDRGTPGRVPRASVAVDVVVSLPVTAARRAAVPATVRSIHQADLATRMSGIVERVPVNIGSRVARGEVLLELDGADIEARIARAEARLRQATRAYSRFEALARDSAATQQELDDARAGLETSQAALDEALAQRRYAALRAPFAGTVTGRYVDPGDLAVPDRPVLTLLEPRSLKVVADVAGAHAGRVRVGETVAVSDPATGRSFRARVTRISPALEPATRRFRLEARLDFDSVAPRSLKPGSFVRLEIPEPDSSALWIPADAVVRRGQLTGVYLVEEGRARLRWIRLGLRRGDAVEVLAGVSPGARVIRDPVPALTDDGAVGAVRDSTFQLADVPGEAAAEPAGAEHGAPASVAARRSASEGAGR